MSIVIALALTLSSVSAPAAFAEQQAAQFRTAEPRAFSAEDLRSYGLSAEDARQVGALQAQGYAVRVLPAEEAAQYSGGISNRTWWIIGGVVVIAAVVLASD